MIKQLIIDIAYDNISVSQALTRAKILQRKLDNYKFGEWIKNEIEGYPDNDDVLIPDYRTIPAPTILIAEFPMGRMLEIEVFIPDNFEEKTKENTYFHTVHNSISSIEQNIKELPGMQGQINLSIEKVKTYGLLYENQVHAQHGAIRSGHKLVSKAHFSNIIEQTKQKLLDTLMDLDKQFPNLENDFENNKSNNEAVNNIINNNFYGGQNHTNNAAGSGITINSNNSVFLRDDQHKQLSDLGVDSDHINELNTILSNNDKEKPEYGKKIMGWCASVGSSLAARGIYDAIPKINEFVIQLM